MRVPAPPPTAAARRGVHPGCPLGVQPVPRQHPGRLQPDHVPRRDRHAGRLRRHADPDRGTCQQPAQRHVRARPPTRSSTSCRWSTSGRSGPPTTAIRSSTSRTRRGTRSIDAGGTRTRVPLRLPDRREPVSRPSLAREEPTEAILVEHRDARAPAPWPAWSRVVTRDQVVGLPADRPRRPCPRRPGWPPRRPAGRSPRACRSPRASCPRAVRPPRLASRSLRGRTTGRTGSTPASTRSSRTPAVPGAPNQSRRSPRHWGRCRYLLEPLGRQ